MSNRLRDKTITIRVTEDEYQEIHQKFEESGYSTLREFVLGNAGSHVYTDKENEELLKISAMLANCQRQMRGIGNNCNQLAKHANATEELPILAKLEAIERIARTCKEEVEEIWESIRSQISLAKRRNR